jgi:hypothetical protein
MFAKRVTQTQPDRTFVLVRRTLAVAKSGRRGTRLGPPGWTTWPGTRPGRGCTRIRERVNRAGLAGWVPGSVGAPESAHLEATGT